MIAMASSHKSVKGRSHGVEEQFSTPSIQHTVKKIAMQPASHHCSHPYTASMHNKHSHQRRTISMSHNVQWSEDVIKADPFFGRSRVRFRVPPWVSNTTARDHLA